MIYDMFLIHCYQVEPLACFCVKKRHLGRMHDLEFLVNLDLKCPVWWFLLLMWSDVVLTKKKQTTQLLFSFFSLTESGFQKSLVSTTQVAV